jgi:tetratricopeptide (TPR) repeat protein
VTLIAWLAVSLGGVAADEVDPDVQAVKRHFSEGKARYEAGDYQGALDQFQQARIIRELPALDYNIARCHERLERWQDAIDAYERYLRGAPDAEDAPDARARVEVLRRRLAQLRSLGPPPPSTPTRTVAPAPAPSQPSVEPPAPTNRRWWLPVALVTAGAVAALGVAIGLYATASSDLAGLRGGCGRDATCAQDQVDSITARGDASYALFAVAGALAAVDVALVVLGTRARHPEPRAWLAPTGTGMALAGSF